ncbi:hypothetical protein SNOG_11279 [Parastagonospora nodorum SN15]|uniref:Uncharacterized protein n=1 Tax=Phaeosphaeria nodorum (strain SN15 / ATCC MYA-4574 / FGSC 10173) TaxID=321614 RepID=Q0UAD5_PHANO|nr:hypothetical protein SNOG_11279 [Parastagonospora nodorum SN15]EAT80987.1 hypothetical protein SNOG_11279 [Parastagonospora nodorum SN15]
MSRRNGRPRSRRKGSTTSSAPISRQPSQGPQDIQRQILPPTPTSPVNKDCGELVPSPELVAPESSLGVSVQPLNTTTTANISNEKQHVKSHPDIRPEIHRQNLALEPYGGAAVDLTSASFPTLSFFDDPTNALQCDSSAFTFTPMFSPSQTRSDTDISQVFSFDYFGGGSESAWTELTTTTSSHTGDLPVDLNTSTIVCSCSTLLIHQLDRSASLMDNGQGDGRCGPKPSSALLLCQAMDEVSVLLGMGTVWGEVPSGQLMCSTTNLAQDELLMRCGTYTVRRTDQRALLQTLMMKRFSEMQRAIYNLEKIVTKEDAASSLCHEVYAGMVTELKRKVASKVEHLKTLMQ